ncbi:putative btb poz domain-containing protein [Lasiodiplodia theobromae]|nr:putative btb poz domain-containing protein [Lasiodiplodia theobromae]
MIFHVHMYAVGEIYDIPSLKALAARNFDRDVDHAFPRFPAAVRAIYETTPDSDRGLRDRALRVCAAHAAELLANPAFEDVMDQLGVFGKEFARQLVSLWGVSSCRCVEYPEALPDGAAELYVLRGWVFARDVEEEVNQA